MKDKQKNKYNNKLNSKRKAWLKASGVIAVSVFIITMVFPFSNILELKTQDLRASLSSGSDAVKAEAPILIAAIDDPSFEAINIRWPWPRQIFAEAIHNLNAAGAKVIALDIMLGDAGYNKREDIALRDAFLGLRNSGKSASIVLPSKIEVRETEEYTMDYIDMPLDMFRRHADSTGYVNLPIDQDGYVRRVYPFNFSLNTGSGRPEQAFSVAVLSAYSQSDFVKSSSGFENSSFKIPLTRSKPMAIQYAPPGSFETVSFYRLLEKPLDPAIYKDRIILIGAFFKESHDQLLTPLENSYGLYGIEVHANIINTIYTQNFLTSSPSWFNFVLLIFIIITASFALSHLRPTAGIITMLTGVFGYNLIVILLYLKWNFILAMVDPSLAIMFSWVGAMVFNFGVVDKEKRQMRSMFSRYVAPEVVDKILKSGSDLSLGGQTREVVIFFSDICGFTALSEKLQPAEVVEMLNVYFTEMTDVIFKYHGTFNKYIGDAIMAFYGAPVEMEDCSEKAVRACLEMRKKLQELNEKRASENLPAIKIGMGLHKGEALVGNIGSVKQMEYTIIGDAVNVSSRIEGLTRDLKTDFLISEEIYRDTKDLIDVKTHEPVFVKGKTNKITVHSVIGYKDESKEESKGESL
ncbi:MAG: adenylate/guanylate cyclase domain-containing protein [Leptospirales bacterium]